MIPQTKVWQDTTGYTCAFVDKFSKDYDNWMLPVRASNMTLDEFAKYVVENFNPCHVVFTTYLGFWWKTEVEARKYKNWINAIFRKNKFEIL